jgi:hypothetical protein
MRGVNAGVRRLSLGLADTDPIPFFCECQTASCYSPVWLLAALFDTTVAAENEWVLKHGHEPSMPWPSRDAGTTPYAIPLTPTSQQEPLGGSEAT